MARQCTVCAHADKDKIDTQLVGGATLDAVSKTYGLTVAALQRHQKNHIPQRLVKAQDAKEIAAADTLMDRVAELDRKAEDVYTRALNANNLTAAIQSVRELRGVTELYAKITGEIQQQTITNIVVMPEWVTLRSAILRALEPYPEALQAVINAIGGGQIDAG